MKALKIETMVHPDRQLHQLSKDDHIDCEGGYCRQHFTRLAPGPEVHTLLTTPIEPTIPQRFLTSRPIFTGLEI